MFGLENSDSVYTATDLAVAAGKHVRVFSATWLSDGTARDLVLRNGAADSATVWVTAGGTISKSVTLDFGPHGILFNAGCFIDIGSAASVVLTYRVELN
jgi:hypothetical protein